MAYDYQSALKQGATEDQVLQYLTKSRSFDIKGAMREGATKRDIIDYLSTTDHPKKIEQEAITQEPVKDVRTKVEKVGDFLGIGNLGRAVGQTAFILTPEYRQLKKDLEEGRVSPEEFESIATGGITNKQILGSAVQTGLNVATAGLPIPKGGTAVSRIGKTAVQGAGLGAGFGASGALQANKDVEGVVKGAATGAATGAVVSGGLQATGEALSKAMQYLPQRIMKNIINQPKKELIAGKDVSQYAIEKKKIGTYDQLINGGQKAITDLNIKISGFLKQGSEQGASVGRDDVLELVSQKINSAGGQIDKKEVFEIISNLSPQAKGILGKERLNLIEANRLRQLLDQTLGDRAFLQSQVPFNKSVLRDFANVLREDVKSKAPTGTRQLFSDLSKEITLRDALVDTAAQRSKNQILSLGDLIGAGLGGFGGLPGAVGGVAIKRTIQSPATGTITAVAMDQFNTKIAPLLNKSQRQVVQNFISQIIGSSTNQ